MEYKIFILNSFIDNRRESDMKIYWATELRSFLQHLDCDNDIAEFECEKSAYDVKTPKQRTLSKIIRWRIWDYFGAFKVIRVYDKDCDAYASFNRFLRCDKPYFIYLESPVALYHYSINRISHTTGKKRFKRCTADANLKYIICMSKACRDSFERINGVVNSNVKLSVIYPYVPSNVYASAEMIKAKSKNQVIELLYLAQGIRFISKGGLEVIEAFRRIKSKCENIHLTIITKIADVDQSIVKQIENESGVTLYDFKFSYAGLEKIYAGTNILLHPTSDDSSCLTILEAMKGGCAIVATSLYAIPEMVADGENGFLIEPKYWFYNEDNIPNPKVWNHRKSTIYSKKISMGIVNEISLVVQKLYNDRNLLETMSMNSLARASNDVFGEESIKNQWKKILSDI